MAYTYTSKQDYSKAIYYYKKALKLYEKFTEEGVSISKCHSGLAEIYLKMGDKDKVSEQLKLAEKFNHYVQKNHFENVIDLAPLIKVHALHNQNYRLAYQQSKKQIYLDSAYQAAQTGVAAINFLKNQLSLSDGRSRLVNDNYPIYEGFLQTLKAFKEDSTDKKAFEVAEQCKSLQLYEAMKNTKAVTFGQVPPQYLAQEKIFSIFHGFIQLQ